jgi:hypothetical protein
MKVLRLLVYEGPEEWVQDTLNRSIQGKREMGQDKSITAISIGTLPDNLNLLIQKEGEEG